MAYAKNQAVINRPIAEVFAYVADGENNIAWRGGILEVARTSAATGLEATYRQVITGPNGRQVRHDYKVTEYQPVTALGFKHLAGIAKPSGRFEFIPDGDGRTLVSFEMSWKARGPQRFFDKMIGAWATTEVNRLDTLKQVLEHRIEFMD